MWKKLYDHLLEHKLVDSAIVIAFITAFSYLLTYIYESTYMDYFGAVEESARVELVPILTTSFIVFGVILVAAAILFFIAKWTNRDDRAWRIVVRAALLPLFEIVLGVLPMLYAEYPDDFKRHVIRQLQSLGEFILFVLVAGLVFGAIMIACLKKLKREAPEPYMRKILRRTMPLNIFAPLILILFCFLYASILPIISAYNRTEFKDIVINNESLLVIREYSDHMIAMKYDAKNNKLMPEYHYINYHEGDNFTYTVIYKKPKYTSKFLEDMQAKNSEGLMGG